MAFGQMGWAQPYGFAPQAAMDQLAQLRAQQQYNPQMAAQMPQQIAAQQQPQQGAPIWVQGEAGAKSFLVAPGQSLILMDSEADVFYIKSSDQSGMPQPLRTFDYKERVTGAQRPVQAAHMPVDQYVTRAEYEAMLAKLAEITAKISAMPAKQQMPEYAARQTMREDEIDA